jgi:uncharacterized protein YegP (UPF0339 family)
MKNLVLSFCFLLLYAGVSLGQSCNCTICPYQPSPPCFDVCVTRLLANTNLDELIYIVGVKEETARRIVGWEKRSTATTLEDYQEIIPPADLKVLADRANSLNFHQLNYLNRDRSVLEDTRLPQMEDPGAEPMTPGEGIKSTQNSEGGTSTTTMGGSRNAGGVIGAIAGGGGRPLAAKPTRGQARISYYYYRDRNNEWRWRLKSAGGPTLAISAQSYKSEQECLNAIERVKASSTTKVVKEKQ